MNLTSAGIGSGLDLEGIIKSFVTAKSVPQEVRLQKKENLLKTELSGIGQFKSALSSFDSVLKSLTKTDAFNKQVVAASTDDISVKSNGFASNGSFSVEVVQLAQGSRLQSTSLASSSATVGSGTLTLKAGAKTFDVAVGASDSLSAIRDKVNAQAGNFGVTANIINTDAGSILVYNSSVSGDGNNLSVTTSDASLNAISVNNVQNPVKDIAKSAKVNVDGNLITKDTNEFKNVIEDVTFVAKKVNVGKPSTITVAQDTENGKKLLTDFVNGYNNLVNTLSTLSNPKTGKLAFNPAIRQMKSQFNKLISDPVSGLSGTLKSLDDIGISTNKLGLLEVSAVTKGGLKTGIAKQGEALKDKLKEIGELFAKDNGVATKMRTLVAGYNDSDGSLTKQQTLLNVDLKKIPKEYERLQTSLRDYESTLRKQFTFLDATVSKFNATSKYLTTALAPQKKK